MFASFTKLVIVSPLSKSTSVKIQYSDIVMPFDCSCSGTLTNNYGQFTYETGCSLGRSTDKKMQWYKIYDFFFYNELADGNVWYLIYYQNCPSKFSRFDISCWSYMTGKKKSFWQWQTLKKGKTLQGKMIKIITTGKFERQQNQTMFDKHTNASVLQTCLIFAIVQVGPGVQV